MVSACFHVIKQKDEQGEQRKPALNWASGHRFFRPDTFAAEETPPTLGRFFTLVWAEMGFSVSVDRKTALVVPTEKAVSIPD